MIDLLVKLEELMPLAFLTSSNSWGGSRSSSYVGWNFFSQFCTKKSTMRHLLVPINQLHIIGYEIFNWCSDAMRTRETLKIMQEQVRGFSEAEVHFISSFYSIAAMDGQTAEHLQQAICNFARDEIMTVM